MSKQIVGYDFTLRVEKSDKTKYTYKDVANLLQPLCKKFVFQMEKGERSEYLHFQGRIRLNKKMVKSTLLKSFEGISLEDLPSFSPTVAEVYKTNDFDYVLKSQTRIEGPWKDTDFEREELKPDVYIPRQYRIDYNDLYPYQKYIYDHSIDFDTRTVNVLVDETGSIGKSTIANIATIKNDGLIIPNVRDSERIIYSVCNIVSSLKIRKTVPIFVDMPRSMNQKDLKDFYAAIETIKGGRLYDTRNSYVQWYIDSPCIWVFCNEKPSSSLLSRNRWKIWAVNDEKELIPYIDEDSEGSEESE